MTLAAHFTESVLKRGITKETIAASFFIFTLFRQLTGNPIPISEKDDQFHVAYWLKANGNKVKNDKSSLSRFSLSPILRQSPTEKFPPISSSQGCRSVILNFQRKYTLGKILQKTQFVKNSLAISFTFTSHSTMSINKFYCLYEFVPNGTGALK